MSCPELFEQQFSELVSTPDEQVELDRAALVIGGCEYPELIISDYLRRLDNLAACAAEQMPSNFPSLEVRAQVVANFLFRQRKFTGNVENYYDPRNSYLNEVLDRRLGIPITLSILYIEVARRLKLKVEGIGLPGHFVVRVTEGKNLLYMDPFNEGRLLDEGDCHEIVLHAVGQKGLSSSNYLNPMPKKAILSRVLSNLKHIYAHQNDRVKVIRLLNQIIQLRPETVEEYKERGLLHFEAGRYRAALSDLTVYLERSPFGPDTITIHHYIDSILTQIERA